jgi:hypothetical protein
MPSGSWSFAALVFLLSLFPSILYSAQSNSAIGAAKNDAEANGFTFNTLPVWRNQAGISPVLVSWRQI